MFYTALLICHVPSLAKFVFCFMKNKLLLVSKMLFFLTIHCIISFFAHFLYLHFVASFPLYLLSYRGVLSKNPFSYGLCGKS